MNPRAPFKPPPERFFPYLRWSNLGLRGLHLIGIAGLAGGFLFDLPEPNWSGYWRLALTSGVLLTALYLWTDAQWLMKLKGQAIVAKLFLLALADLYPEWGAPIFVLIILVSAIFAHAPDRVRSFSWGRKVKPCKAAIISEESKSRP